MALPATGNPLSISQIRAELSNTGKSTDVSLRFLGNYEYASFYVPINQSSTNKPDLTNPFRIAEWYSYDHSAYRSCSNVIVTTPALTGVPPLFPPPGTGRLYYKLRITGNDGDVFKLNISVLGAENGNGDYGFKLYTFIDTYPFNSSGVMSSSWTSDNELVAGDYEFEYYLKGTQSDYHLVFELYDGIIQDVLDPDPEEIPGTIGEN